MRKRITVLSMTLLTIVVLTPTIFADTINLNLEKAYQMTLEDNISLKIAQKNLKNKEIQYKKSNAQNLLNQSNYSEISAEYNLLAAKKNYIDTANNLLKQTLQQYGNILITEKNIETYKKQITLNKKLLDEVKAQYNVGEKSQLDILDQQIKLNDFIQEKNQLENEYEHLKTKFKQQLGLNRETSINLKELLEPEYINLSEEEIINSALNNNLNSKLNELNLQLAQIDYKKKEVVSSSEMDINIAKNIIDVAEFEIEKSEQEIKNQARDFYNQINNTKSNIELLNDKIKQSNDTYNILKEQNKSGLITENDLYQGEISVLQSNLQLYNAYINYYLQKQSIEQFMNPGAGVLRDEQ